MKLRILVGLLVIIAIAVGCGRFFWSSLQAVRGKSTVTTMVRLGESLFIELGLPLGDSIDLELSDSDLLEALFQKYPTSGEPVDSWGSNLILESRPRIDEKTWLLISLGKDQQRGSCCRPLVHRQWDQDAVLLISAEGTEWLQKW